MEKALRNNQEKVKLSLIDLSAMEDCAKVLDFGAKKYSRDNWKKGLVMSEILDSMLRHISALRNGEYLDQESGLPHIGHIQCNAMFLGGKDNIDDLNLKCTNKKIESDITYTHKQSIPSKNWVVKHGLSHSFKNLEIKGGANRLEYVKELDKNTILVSFKDLELGEAVLLRNDNSLEISQLP